MPVSAPAEQGRWQRVYTGDDFVVEVNPESLTFAPDHTCRAHFRTVLSKPETISRDSTTKYKIRLETIDFKLGEKRYRYFETSLLDAAGTLVLTYPTGTSDWKLYQRGGFTERLFEAVRALSPFGRWQVIAYRYADGKPKEAIEAHELAKLHGTSVTLDVDAAQVGAQRCSSPAYQSRVLAEKEVWPELGTLLNTIGVEGTETDTISLRCETQEWSPPQSLILKLPSGHMLLLWKGVFLELKKQR